MNMDMGNAVGADDLGLLCICAIRYAMGRMSYMPDMIRSIVQPLLSELSDRDIRVMHDDCKFQANVNMWGDERIDKPGWLQWEQELKAEKARREKDGG